MKEKLWNRLMKRNIYGSRYGKLAIFSNISKNKDIYIISKYTYHSVATAIFCINFIWKCVFITIIQMQKQGNNETSSSGNLCAIYIDGRDVLPSSSFLIIIWSALAIWRIYTLCFAQMNKKKPEIKLGFWNLVSSLRIYNPNVHIQPSVKVENHIKSFLTSITLTRLYSYKIHTFNSFTHTKTLDSWKF